MVLPPAVAHRSGGGGGGGGRNSGGGNIGNNRNKSDPELAKAIHASLHTRTIPVPRPEGVSDKARQAAEDAATEEGCAICMEKLPDTGRAIVPCGHVFCFTCVHVWINKDKGTKPRCPTCRQEITKIWKTLTPEDIAKEEARLEMQRKMELTKNQSKRGKKKASSIKIPIPGVMVKTIRLRDKTKKKKTLSNLSQYIEDNRRRQEEQQQIQWEQAQTRQHELAAEALRVANTAAETARALRERATRAAFERERSTRKAAALAQLEAAASAKGDSVGAGQQEVVRPPSLLLSAVAAAAAAGQAPAPSWRIPAPEAAPRRGVDGAGATGGGSTEPSAEQPDRERMVRQRHQQQQREADRDVRVGEAGDAERAATHESSRRGLIARRWEGVEEEEEGKEGTEEEEEEGEDEGHEEHDGHGEQRDDEGVDSEQELSPYRRFLDPRLQQAAQRAREQRLGLTAENDDDEDESEDEEDDDRSEGEQEEEEDEEEEEDVEGEEGRPWKHRLRFGIAGAGAPRALQGQQQQQQQQGEAHRLHQAAEEDRHVQRERLGRARATGIEQEEEEVEDGREETHDDTRNGNGGRGRASGVELLARLALEFSGSPAGAR
eukprot:g8995.t1